MSDVTRYTWTVRGLTPDFDGYGAMRYVRETDYDRLGEELRLYREVARNSSWLEDALALLHHDRILQAQEIERLRTLIPPPEADRNVANVIRTLISEQAALREELELYREIARNSEGVAGWHLNGDIATWGELGIER